MKTIYILLVFLNLALFSFAEQENFEYYFNNANKNYTNKDYDNAILMYKKIIDSGVYGGNIYYNIGNCYFRKQDYGMSMLYYQKARKLIPNNESLKNNINIIDSLYIKDKIENKRWWGFIVIDYVVDKLNMRDWIILSFIFYIFLCYFIISYIKTKKSFTFSMIFNIGFLLFIIVSLSSYKYYNDYYLAKGVIIKDNITIKSGPLDENDDLFKLNSGIICRILEKNNGWVRIRLANGLSGWVDSSVVEKI